MRENQKLNPEIMSIRYSQCPRNLPVVFGVSRIQLNGLLKVLYGLGWPPLVPGDETLDVIGILQVTHGLKALLNDGLAEGKVTSGVHEVQQSAQVVATGYSWKGDVGLKQGK